MSRKALLVGVAGLASWLVAAEAFACPVCYGQSDSPVIEATGLSIVFMAILTYGLILGGVALFFVLRRRVRRLEQVRESSAEIGFGAENPA